MDRSLSNVSRVNSHNMVEMLQNTFGNDSSPSSFSKLFDSLTLKAKDEENSKIEGNGGMAKKVEQFSSMLPGDFATSFKIENPTPHDKEAEPQGMAKGAYKEYSPEGDIRVKTIDKTSTLYEKALELESYFVKIMTDSMRSTLTGKTLAGDESFASKMYKDMMYDELNRSLTKNAGFGLADHIYLQLNH